MASTAYGLTSNGGCVLTGKTAKPGRSITPEMAWLLGEALGTTAQYWLNLENTYRLKTLDIEKLKPVEKLVSPL